MKYVLFVLSFALLFCCRPNQQKASSSRSSLEERPSKGAEAKWLEKEKVAEEYSSPDKPSNFFPKQEIWDKLRKICPSMEQHTFHIADIEKAALTNIDSSILFTYIHSIYGLSSVYPIKVIELPGIWKGLIFWGEQYDSDRLTEFLAMATIDSTFEKKGEVVFISAQGDEMGEYWDYYSEFLNDSTFKLIREERFDCEEDFRDSMKGEISQLNLEELYSLKEAARFQKISSDTLKLIRCK